MLSDELLDIVFPEPNLAKLPLAKEIDEFDFEDTPINETLVRDLTGGEFLEHQRNVVLIGGTGTGKTRSA